MSRSAIQAKKQQKKKLSPAQRKFNSTIRKIEKEKALLAKWQETVSEFEVKRSETFTPLMERYNQARAEFVRRLDKFFTRKSFSGVQRDKMAYFIEETSAELIAAGFDDLREIHDSYSPESFDEMDEQMRGATEDALRDIFESELGIDLGDDFDIDNPEAVAARVAEQMEEKERQEAEGNTTKQKTAKETKKEAKQREEEEKVSQSIKSVYRELTRALHPDRETDESERLRKTELMQKVTGAYREKDLLKLLELQLEVEQIDQTMIDDIADDRLKHFIKVLERQLEDIRMEVEAIAMPLQQMSQIHSYGVVSPAQVMKRFKEDTEQLKQDTLTMEEDLSGLKTVKGIQQWLRDYNLPNPFDFFGDDPFDLPPEFFR